MTAVNMASADGVKGHKKGDDWSIGKQAGVLLTICLAVFATVLVLDAYKFVSFKHAEVVRAKADDVRTKGTKFLRTNTSNPFNDPSMIKVNKDEFDKLKTDLEKVRADASDMNAKVQAKDGELQIMQQTIDELKKVAADKAAADQAVVDKAAADKAAADKVVADKAAADQAAADKVVADKAAADQAAADKVVADKAAADKAAADAAAVVAAAAAVAVDPAAAAVPAVEPAAAAVVPAVEPAAAAVVPAAEPAAAAP